MKHTASVTAMQPPVCGTTVQELEAFLRSNVSELEEEECGGPGGPGRPRQLAERWLWASLLVCLLRGLRSQKAIWRLLCLGLGPMWAMVPCVLTPQAV